MAKFTYQVQEILNRCFDVTNNRLNVFPKVNDDESLAIGADKDAVLHLSSAGLAADQELTGVIVGTSNHQGVGANSLIVSNITTDGDMIFLVSDGGNSLEFLRVDASAADMDIGFGMATLELIASGAITLTPGNGLTIGLAASAPAPDLNGVHIWGGSAGAVVAQAGPLIVESSAGTYIQLLSPADQEQGIIFGDVNDANIGMILYGHSANTMTFTVNAANQLIWTDGVMTAQKAMALKLAGGYVELTERAAPGAGAADTARIYAVVDGTTLTDLAAVFQDGTVDIFAQETTPLDAPILINPSGTQLRMELRKPHPGIVQILAVFPNGDTWVVKEYHYHDTDKVRANVGAEALLPTGWFQETAAARKARAEAEKARAEAEKASSPMGS